MSIVKANSWSRRDASGNEVTAGAPIKITQITVPYSTATSPSSGYITLASSTTSNTGQLYTFNYTPAKSSSYVFFQGFFNMDRISTTGPESLYIFINNTPYAISYTYPRVNGHEPWQSRGLSGVFNNTTGSTMTFSLRVRSSFTSYVGSTTNNDQVMSNTIQIIEYLK
jgi:hypothetical protein